jgi:L-ascorbate metabolism protein UlaG (beta-lactamase superfamily)
VGNRIAGLVRRSALLVPVGAGVALARAAWDVPLAVGAQPRGERLARMRRSPNYVDGAFVNPVAATMMPPSSGPGVFRELVFGKEKRRPTHPVPLAAPAAADLTAPPLDGLRLTWLGHATVLAEVEGRRVLFDPVWSDRVSPSALLGPKRLHPMPMALGELPPVDAVVISHDHYDHLDMATIRRLAVHSPRARFVVPLGVGAHLERWGIPPGRIDELDWTESVEVAGITLTATTARHFSGRLKPGGNGTLWASWVVAGARRRIFYTGDSGYFDGYADIGAAHGPFDATLIQVGAYSPYWPDVHMTPEEGVATHLAVRGELLVPVHWCTFNLAIHSWDEPVERLLADAASHDVQVAVPRPGELLDVAHPTRPTDWWRAVA